MPCCYSTCPTRCLTAVAWKDQESTTRCPLRDSTRQAQLSWNKRGLASEGRGGYLSRCGAHLLSHNAAIMASPSRGACRPAAACTDTCHSSVMTARSSSAVRAAHAKQGHHLCGHSDRLLAHIKAARLATWVTRQDCEHLSPHGAGDRVSGTEGQSGWWPDAPVKAMSLWMTDEEANLGDPPRGGAANQRPAG